MPTDETKDRAAEDAARAAGGEYHPRYNGWANRETWNTHLWMTNDQELLADAQAIMRQYIDDATDDAPRTVDTYGAGEALREWWDETFAPESAGPLSDAWSATMSAVNWDEIAESLAEE